jgi:polyphosphate kinase 2 (PPK2 family)
VTKNTKTRLKNTRKECGISNTKSTENACRWVSCSKVGTRREKAGPSSGVAQGLDPRGYVVVPFAAPNDVEKRHHYLWRFWINLPKGGHITIFDRSWYGRVLVERVEGFCTKDEWNTGLSRK